MRKRLITIVSYLSIIFFAPFLLGANAEAALCPGTTSNYTCTYVNPTTCIASDVSRIPAYASTAACETCRTPGVTVPTLAYTWLNYPSGGTSNSGEPYIHIPMPAATTYQTVHLYSSRLGCSGRANTEYPTGANPLVGIMSIKNGSELSYDSGYSGDFMNQKLEQYAASYNTYKDPIYESMLTPSLKDFRVLPIDGSTVDGWTHRDFLNITVYRNNPYGRNYMQFPGTSSSGVINIPIAMARCEAGGQFATDNDCDLTIYIGAGAQEGYAVLDMVAYLKIRRVLPTAAITFSGNVVSNVSTAKIGDGITFTHSMGASYLGDIRNARADYVFSGNAIASPSAPRTIGPINYLNAEIMSQSATATETHTVTLADAQRGSVCRTISWTSSATTPVPTNSPAGRSVQRCVTITPPTMTVSGTVTKASPATTSANVGQAIIFRSAPNVTYSNGANSPVTYTLRTTSSATSTVLRTWTTTPGVQQTAFTSPSRDLSYTPVLADAVAGQVCRYLHWSYPHPLTGVVTTGYTSLCVPINKPVMNVTGTLTSNITEASLTKAITLTSAPNVTYSYSANSKVIYNLCPTSTACSGATAIKSWETTPGVQQTAFTSPSATHSFLPTLAEAVAGEACRYLHWSYPDPLTPATIRTGFVENCTDVTYSYELTPSVTVPSTVEPGASITPEPKVTRVGDPLSANSNWTLTRVILPASNTTDFGTSPVTNAAAPSTHYNNLSGTVSELHGSGSNIFSADSTDLAVSAFAIPGTLQLGQRVCFGLSVRPYTNASTDYRHSALACVTITKSPSTQIHGGGLLVAEGKVIGGSSKKLIGIDNKTFGSWVEYDITANGTVDQMVASAMGYGLEGTISGIGSHLQKLTFANKNVPYGVFGSANNLSHSLFEGSLTNPYSFFQPLAVSLAVDPVSPASLGAITGQTKVYTHTGDITLNASTLPLGHQIVLIAENGNIYINGNQTYASGITDPKSLPQLVLIAHNGNIVIDEAVTNVDAWLIAGSDASDVSKGQLLTCDFKPTNSTQCDDQLVINGPVMVDYLKLYRIYGADFNSPLGYGSGGLNDPAEIFNLRPDAYIWSLQNSQSNTILKTTHIKDLAPRY